MMLLSKKKGISQADLGKMIGTSGDVVGRYERGDISPSIEVVSKIADALEVSVDYLIGKTRMELDKDTMRRIEDISALPQENKNFVLRHCPSQIEIIICSCSCIHLASEFLSNTS